jgi:hypothetical protein
MSAKDHYFVRPVVTLVIAAVAAVMLTFASSAGAETGAIIDEGASGSPASIGGTGIPCLDSRLPCESRWGSGGGGLSGGGGGGSAEAGPEKVSCYLALTGSSNAPSLDVVVASGSICPQPLDPAGPSASLNVRTRFAGGIDAVKRIRDTKTELRNTFPECTRHDNQFGDVIRIDYKIASANRATRPSQGVCFRHSVRANAYVFLAATTSSPFEFDSNRTG